MEHPMRDYMLVIPQICGNCKCLGIANLRANYSFKLLIQVWVSIWVYTNKYVNKSKSTQSYIVHTTYISILLWVFIITLYENSLLDACRTRWRHTTIKILKPTPIHQNARWQSDPVAAGLKPKHPNIHTHHIGHVIIWL